MIIPRGFEGMALPGPPRREHYKTAVKVAIARRFCTRVRATSVFQKSISKKRFSCEHVCKISRLKGRIMTLSRVLQCFLKVLQNRSEKLKNAFPRAIISILLGLYNHFRTTHTIFTIKLQTFGGRDSEVHFARQKQCFGENYAPDCCKSGPLGDFHYKTAARMP